MEGGRPEPLLPNCYKMHTCTGGQREREGEGREVREEGVHRHKLNVGMPVSLGIYACLTRGYDYASWAARSNS